MEQQTVNISCDQMLDRIHAQLLSEVWHKDKLKSLVSMPLIGDVYIAFFIDLTDLCGKDEDTRVTLPITPEVAEGLGITAQDAFQYSKKNLHGSCRTMASTLTMLCPEEDVPEMTPPLYVITNDNGMKGASAILSLEVQDTITEMCGGPAFLLPSSVHELLACPISVLDPPSLAEMVHEINRAQVAPEERLSDHVFKLENHDISMVI